MEHPIQNGGSVEEEMEGEPIESGSENASIHEIEDGNSSNEELSLRTRKYKSELKLIASCRPSTRRLLFNWGGAELIRSIVDVARTVLEGDLHLLKYDKIKVARNITILRKIADRNRTVMRKRMLLITKKGARAVIDLLNVANKYHVIPNHT